MSSSFPLIPSSISGSIGSGATQVGSPNGFLTKTGPNSYSGASSLLSYGNNGIFGGGNYFNTPGFMSGMSLINSGISAYTSLQAGKIENRLMQLQARQQDIQARQERLRGQSTANALREELLSNLSSANALFASRGISIDSGTARELEIQNRRRAAEDIGQVISGSEIRAIGNEGQAEQFRSQGRSTRIRARYNAFGELRNAANAFSMLSGGF